MENKTIKKLKEELESIANKVISNKLNLNYLDSINLQSIENLAHNIKDLF